MKYTNKILLVIFALSITPLFGQSQVKKNKELDEFIQQGMKDWNIPGLAVTVVQDGKTLMTKTYGVKDQNSGDRVDENTIFSMASTTKAVVAMALGILVDDGKLNWDDKVIDHLPYFKLTDPYVTQEATVKDLLTHNLGLGNADFLWFGDKLNAEETIDRMKHAPMAYSTRSSFIYQNIMYAVAGEVIKAVSGKAWNEFIQQRILNPLEMSSTKLLSEDVLATDNKVTPHNDFDGKRLAIPYTFSDGIGPAGMIWSSISDINNYLKFILQNGVYKQDTILSTQTFDYLFKPHALIPINSFYPTARLTQPNWTSYGLGWFQHDYKGEKVDFHTGSLPGLIALVGQLRSKNLAVYVFANMDHAELRHAIMYKVFDLYALGGERDWQSDVFELYDGFKQAGKASDSTFRAERVQNTSTTLPLEVYSGDYVHEMYGTINITVKNDKLIFNQNDVLKGTFEHWHYNTFIGVSEKVYDLLVDSIINFEIDSDGNAYKIDMFGYDFIRK